MTASGTFGYGIEYSELVDIRRLGAIVCKGTTLEPRLGHPQPRLIDGGAWLLNSIGLQNIGVRSLIRAQAPLWVGWETPVVVNIAGETVAEYQEIASLLEGVPGVAALEVNISCPNVKRGGVEFGADPQAAAEVTAAVRRATSLPVIVKLTPNVSDILPVAQAVEKAGAHALTISNTLRGMAIDIRARRPILGGESGGLSGPALKPLALYLVYRAYEGVSIPIIGCGGIYNAMDAVEFLMAGALAVQVGSASFLQPRAAQEVVDGLEGFLQDEGIQDVKELVGLAHHR